MGENIHYSEPGVNGSAADKFRMLSKAGVKLRAMASEQPLAEYVRHLLHEWKRADKTAKQFALAVGLPPSNVSQVLSGKLGVGQKTVGRFAAGFGLSVPELMARAEEWAAKHAKDVAAVVQTADPACAEAIGVVKGLARVTDAQLRTIVAAYGADRFRGRDAAWWITTLLAEVERDRNGSGVPQQARKGLPREPESRGKPKPPPESTGVRRRRSS